MFIIKFLSKLNHSQVFFLSKDVKLNVELKILLSRRVTFFNKLVDSGVNYEYTCGYYFRVIYEK